MSIKTLLEKAMLRLGSRGAKAFIINCLTGVRYAYA